MRPARDSTSSGLAGWTSCRRIWIDSSAWGWPPVHLPTAALPVVLNAANEVAVAAFFERRLRFTGIAEVIERAMDEFERASPDVKSLGQIRHLDHQARGRAWELARSES